MPRRPHLHRHLAWLLLCSACGQEVEESTPPRLSGVLITLDTTRMDLIGSYGGPPGVTPALDALARESVRFERAYTTAPITLPSHASMMTGLYPPRHTLHDNHLKPLPAAAETLAERAQAAGFETAAFVAAVVLDRAFGLDQGFELYDSPRRAWHQVDGVERHIERRADEVVDAALEWLQARDPERPFFLWVHLFDPHMPHEAPPEFLERTGGRPYLAELAYTDAAVGRLLAGLRELGQLDSSMLAVVADHGEALGDHGEPTHSITCYEATIRVPLFLRPPGGAAQAVVVEEPVSIVDLYPTFVRALELGEPGSVDGLDLSSAELRGDRGVYFESYVGWLNHRWSPLAGWVQGELKYHASSRPELYDVVADRGELRDLIAQADSRAEPHRRALEAIWSRPTLADEDAEAISSSLKRDLQALGYATAASAVRELPDPLAPSTRPSPRDALPEWRALLEASNAWYRGEHETAIDGYRAVLEGNPRSLEARSRLVQVLLATQRWPEAEQRARELLEVGEPRADTLEALGLALERQGRLEQAVEAYRQATELDRTEPESWRALASALRELGRSESADAAAERAEQLTRGESP